MDSDALVTATQLSGLIADGNPDYDAARIRIELDDVLHEVFEKVVVNARQGFWLQQQLTAITAGNWFYRIPPRAVTGGLEKVQVIDGAGQVRHLVYTDLRQAYLYENAGLGEPTAYVILGDQIQLLPKPSVSGWYIRFTYYIQPSRLVEPQTTGEVIAAGDGVIAVWTFPTDQDTSDEIEEGSVIDIVHSNGWHELSLVSATVTSLDVGPPVNRIHVDTNDDLSRVEAGDFVRVQNQTDWPCLPDDFHRALADAAAVVYLVNTGQMAKAQILGSKVQNDIERFKDLISPRVKDSPKILKPSYGFLRGGGRRSGFGMSR